MSAIKTKKRQELPVAFLRSDHLSYQYISFTYLSFQTFFIPDLYEIPLIVLTFSTYPYHASWTMGFFYTRKTSPHRSITQTDFRFFIDCQ